MNQPTEKILSRIKKLLAMGQGTANENEAAIAMRRALHLMAQYNLGLGDFEDETNEIIGRSNFARSRGGPWARSAAFGIAQLYFCEYYYTNRGKRNDIHHFVGKESNRKVAKIVTEFVLNSIDSEAKTTAVIDPRTGTKTPYINSFRNAAGGRVFARCKELIEEAKKGMEPDEYTGTTLPALAPLYNQEKESNVAWIQLNVGGLKKGKSRGRSTSVEGHSSGTAAGNKVSLRPGVSKSNLKGIR